uniref:Secreted protein n=1 Tax=Ascaris lumbricoides TaxID=6252 RepID=A0A0M3HIY3_ASCLU
MYRKQNIFLSVLGLMSNSVRYCVICATLLLVSHGAPIGAIHELLGGNWKYVGQATVSKFVEVKPGKFKKELSSDASHLSDKSNLRPW